MFPLIWSWWQGESPVCIFSEADNFEATRVAYGSGVYVRISALVAVLSLVLHAAHVRMHNVFHYAHQK
jgi:hypothetical protein